MSTRSSLSVKHTNGKIYTVYCHWDGHPEHHMDILENCYNNQFSAEQLINLGDISVLDRSLECPVGHSFDHPVEGYCIAYGRDRQEEGTTAREYDTIQSAVKSETQEYNYFFDGSWKLLSI